MKEETFITNILTLAVAGLLIFLTGISFYYFREFFSRYIRFFLPIPPLAVAAYIYVFNLYDHFKGDLPADPLDTARDIGLSIAVSTAFFALFVILMVGFITLIKKLMS